ncbi:hypothetical protein ACLKA7_000452 [Drosophila subpalustris]
MAMCDVLMLLLLLLPLLTWSYLEAKAAPLSDEVALRQIPKLSHGQVALIAGNATARCQFIPQLCDWQLQLYEGHAFSLQLPQTSNNNNNVASTTTTTTTTSSPQVESVPNAVIFAVPGQNTLFIYAQVERRAKLAKTPKTPKTAKAVGQLQDVGVNTAIDKFKGSALLLKFNK